MALPVKLFVVLAVTLALSSGEAQMVDGQMEEEQMESWCRKAVYPALNQIITDILGTSGRLDDRYGDEVILWPDHPNCTDEAVTGKLQTFVDKTEKIFLCTPRFTEMCSRFGLEKHFYGTLVRWLNPFMNPGYFVCTIVDDPDNYLMLKRVDSGFIEELYNDYSMLEPQVSSESLENKASSECDHEHVQHQYHDQHLKHDQAGVEELKKDVPDTLERSQSELVHYLGRQFHSLLQQEQSEHKNEMKIQQEKHDKAWKQQQVKYERIVEDVMHDRDEIRTELNNVYADISRLELESRGNVLFDEKIKEIETRQQKHFVRLLQNQQKRYEEVLKKKTQEENEEVLQQRRQNEEVLQRLKQNEEVLQQLQQNEEVFQQLRQYEEDLQRLRENEEDMQDKQQQYRKVLLAQEQTDIALKELKIELHDTVSTIDSQYHKFISRHDEHEKSVCLLRDMYEDYLHAQQTLVLEVLDKQKQYQNDLLEKQLFQNQIILKELRYLNNTIAFVKDHSANESQHLQDQQDNLQKQQQEGNCSLALQMQQDRHENVLHRVQEVEMNLKAQFEEQEIRILNTTQLVSRKQGQILVKFVQESFKKIEQRQKEHEENVSHELEELEKAFQWQQQEQKTILQRQQEEQHQHVLHLVEKNEKMILDEQDLFDNLVYVLNMTHGDLLQPFWLREETSRK